MKKLLGLALAAGVAVTAVSAADAAQGCGPGYHRGPYGHCRPNGGPGFGPGYGRGPVAGPGAWVVGQFYPGRGYWDGHRWYHNRRQWHGSYRYY